MNGLGDICDGSSLFCNDSQTAVQQMDNIFQGLPPGLQSQFQGAHDSIMTQFNTQWAAWQASWLPILNPICCTLATIGTQATTLANSMLAANNQAGIPGTQPPPGPDYLSGLITLAIVGVVAFAIYEGKSFFK